MTRDDLFDETSEAWVSVEQAIWPDGPASGHGSGAYAGLKARIIATLAEARSQREPELDRKRLTAMLDRLATGTHQGHDRCVIRAILATLDAARSQREPELEALRALSDAATPGPWIRRWASLDVHHMSGDDALQAQADIDFAVAACAYVRAALEGAKG